MKKNGKKSGKQLYKCNDCGRQFVGGVRLDDSTLIKEYVEDGLTISQLSERHHKCKKTIWSHLRAMCHRHKVSSDKDVVLLMDTTYWGRGFGLMLFKDAYRNKVLWHKFVSHESVDCYLEGVEWLQSQGFGIHAAVCDGMPGLIKVLARKFPVQMCQFHMGQIVRKKLTNHPATPASQELLKIAKSLSKVCGDVFREELAGWHDRWADYLGEKSPCPDGRLRFTHQRLRSAYASLQKYLPYLWTFETCEALRVNHINTNSGIESLNQQLKTMLRRHSGISRERRKTLLEEFMARRY